MNAGIRKWIWLALMTAAGLRVATAGVSEHWYTAVHDHTAAGLTVLVVENEAGRMFIRDLDLKMLNINPRSEPDLRHAGEPYHSAAAMPGYQVHVDPVGRRVYFVTRHRPHTPRPPSRELLLDIHVNGQSLDTPQYVYYAAGELVLPDATMKALGLDASAVRAPLLDGNMPLHAVAGETFTLDYSRLRLDMTVPTEYLRKQRINIKPGAAEARHRPAGSLSAVLGYDLAGGTNLSGEHWESGLFDLALSNGLTTCSSRHLQPAGPGGDFDPLRLDSGCTRDWPEHLFSVSAGDGITRTTLFGQPVRYGGLRFGTDFALAPGLVTQPRLALNGSARVPSTLEIWVDRALTLTTDIPPGPFEIDDIPVQTGAGDIRAVIRNELGERVVLSQPFYSDPVLLAPGLNDWAVELGQLREHYATPDSDYTDRIGALSGRFGLSRWLTLDVRAETQELEAMPGTANHTAGIGAAVRLWKLGVLEVGKAAGQHGDNRRGEAERIGFSRRGRYLSFGIRRFTSDPDFVQLGYPSPGEAPAETTQASIGGYFGGGVSLNLGGFRRHYHDGRRQEVHTAGLNIRLGRLGSLHFAASQPVEPEEDPFYTAYLTIPLGSRTHASASAGGHREVTQRQVGVQRNLPAGPGYGYRIDSGERNTVRYDDAELGLQGNSGRLRLSGRRRGEDTAGSAQLTGAVIFSREGAFLSRQTPDSYGIVKLPADNVRIYHDERLVAVTDGDGEAVIPGLRPYQANRLRLAVEDLPLDTSLETAEMTVTAGRRQVVNARFDARRTRHVAARLMRRGGEPVPAGALARTTAMDVEETVIGYNGQLYMPLGKRERLQLWVKWADGQCRVNARVPSSRRDGYIDLGPVHCLENSR